MATPFTGERIYDLPVASEADVDAAFAILRRGQVAWAARPLSERTSIILRYHDLVLARRDEGLDIVQWETGKARRDAMEELLDICINARHYARDARRLLRPRHHRGVFPAVVGVTQLQHPKGVVGFLAPWNYPLTLAVSDAIPALIAGNAALIKPDVQTSLSALWAIDLMVEAGVPADVIRVVAGEGPVVGPMVIDRSTTSCSPVRRASAARSRAVRAAADRLFAGARREERDDRPRGRGHRAGRGHRRPRVLLELRPAVHLDGADLRPRGGVLRPSRRRSPPAC